LARSFLEGLLQARSPNERSDAQNHKSVAMGYSDSVHSAINGCPGARWSRDQQICTISARVGHSKRIHLSE